MDKPSTHLRTFTACLKADKILRFTEFAHKKFRKMERMRTNFFFKEKVTSLGLTLFSPFGYSVTFIL